MDTLLKHSQIGQRTTVLCASSLKSGTVVYVDPTGYRTVETDTGKFASGYEVWTY